MVLVEPIHLPGSNLLCKHDIGRLRLPIGYEFAIASALLEMNIL